LASAWISGVAPDPAGRPSGQVHVVGGRAITSLSAIIETVGQCLLWRRWAAGVLGLVVAFGPVSAGCITNVATGAPTNTAGSKAQGVAKVFPVDGHGVYVRCVGRGSPTIVLVSGAGVSSAGWDYVGDTTDTANPPEKSPKAVEPQLARITRVCSYDRPGTTGFDDSPSRSSPVSQPTTAQGDARTLHDALRAAGVTPPYVLVGHSWGGFIATTYDRLYPNQVGGMVLIDPGSQYLETVLPPGVWNGWMWAIAASGSKNPNGEQPDYPASIAFLSTLPRAKRVPTVVLTSDKPIDFLGIGDAPRYHPNWVRAQALLSRSLGGRQITNTDSGHFVQTEHPSLVVAQTKRVLEALKVPGGA
jgi:pimeloyl-ACP methyl ester carboxylesterase